MDTFEHSLNTLFSQLGLGSTQRDIDNFIDKNKGLQSNIHLAQAPFWSESQKQFINESLSDDGDWSEVIDQLDSMLR